MNRNTSLSTFQAVRDLKHTDDQLTILQNRIRLLQEHQKRFNNKIDAKQKYLESLNEKRRLAQQQSKEKQNRKQDLDQKNKQLQQRNKLIKDLRTEKINNLRQGIIQLKRLDCEMTKNTSQKLQKKIQALKQSYLNQNKKRRDIILLSEEKGKENIKNKQFDRSETIKHSTHLTIHEMVDKKTKKQKQIRRLQKIEQQLLEKCDNSHRINTSLKQEVDNRLGVPSTPKKPIKILPYIQTTSKIKLTASDFFNKNQTESYT